jgi:hypothetical protein
LKAYKERITTQMLNPARWHGEVGGDTRLSGIVEQQRQQIVAWDAIHSFASLPLLILRLSTYTIYGASVASRSNSVWISLHFQWIWIPEQAASAF